MSCNFALPRQKRTCKHKAVKDGLCSLHYNKQRTTTQECFICLEMRPLTLLSCQHALCTNCIIRSASCLCPLCRKNIYPELHKDQVELVEYIQNKDKQISELNNTANTYMNWYSEIYTILVQQNHVQNA